MSFQKDTLPIVSIINGAESAQLWSDGRVGLAEAVGGRTLMSNVEIDPDWLNKGADDMTMIQGKLTSTVTILTTSLAGRGRPWGTDSYSKKFADGGNGYPSSAQTLISGAQSLTSVLGTFATGLNNAATTVRENEQVISDSFNRS
jgi:hypothetical protein